MVIENLNGFDWSDELHVEIDGNIKSCDPKPLIIRDGAFVTTGNLSVTHNRTGYISINMSRVAWRHGQTATRLFLPMEAIDDAINY